MSFFQSIKLVMGHGPYVKLVGAFLFTSLAFMVRADTVSFPFFWLFLVDLVLPVIVFWTPGAGPGVCRSAC